MNVLVLSIIKLTLDFIAKWCFGKYEATETCFYWGLKCRCRNISVIHRQEVSLQLCFDVETNLYPEALAEGFKGSRDIKT